MDHMERDKDLGQAKIIESFCPGASPRQLENAR